MWGEGGTKDGKHDGNGNGNGDGGFSRAEEGHSPLSCMFDVETRLSARGQSLRVEESPPPLGCHASALG